MQEALSVNQEIIDIHHAGAAMCFLKAYSAVNDGSSDYGY
jgi:hypothetical protein